MLQLRPWGQVLGICLPPPVWTPLPLHLSPLLNRLWIPLLHHPLPLLQVSVGIGSQQGVAPHLHKLCQL